MNEPIPAHSADALCIGRLIAERDRAQGVLADIAGLCERWAETGADTISLGTIQACLYRYSHTVPPSHLKRSEPTKETE